MGYRGAVNKEYTSAINDCQAQRFSVSSNPTIKTAVSHWEPFAFEHGLELLVENGDPNRGGVMASFALYLARKHSRMEKFKATFGAWISTMLTTASIHLWTMFKIGPGGCVRWMFKSTHLHVFGFHVLWSPSAIHVFSFLLGFTLLSLRLTVSHTYVFVVVSVQHTYIATCLHNCP